MIGPIHAVVVLLLASVTRGYVLLPLPDGVRPEGVTAGGDDDLWVACLSGAVVHVDLATNTSRIVHREPGVALSGAKFCPQQKILFAAGSLSGKGYLFHMEESSSSNGATDVSSSGKPQYVLKKKEVVKLAMPGVSYINDVAMSHEHVYFTDSFHDAIYSIPRYAVAARGTAAHEAVSTLQKQLLMHPTGAYFDTKLGQYRANGLAVYNSTPQQDTLLVANTHTGNMYRVIVDTTAAGTSTASSTSAAGVKLPGLLERNMLHGKQMPPAAVHEYVLPSVQGGKVKDRLLLDGVWVLNSSMAFVADNYNNRVWGLSLSANLETLKLACRVELPVFRVPTTITLQRGRLWVTNAHLDTCFPFLPCPRHKFELVGIDPDECKPWKQ